MHPIEFLINEPISIMLDDDVTKSLAKRLSSYNVEISAGALVELIQSGNLGGSGNNLCNVNGIAADLYGLDFVIAKSRRCMKGLGYHTFIWLRQGALKLPEIYLMSISESRKVLIVNRLEDLSSDPNQKVCGKQDPNGISAILEKILVDGGVIEPRKVVASDLEEPSADLPVLEQRNPELDRETDKVHHITETPKAPEVKEEPPATKPKTTRTRQPKQENTMEEKPKSTRRPHRTKPRSMAMVHPDTSTNLPIGLLNSQGHLPDSLDVIYLKENGICPGDFVWYYQDRPKQSDKLDWLGEYDFHSISKFSKEDLSRLDLLLSVAGESPLNVWCAATQKRFLIVLPHQTGTSRAIPVFMELIDLGNGTIIGNQPFSILGKRNNPDASLPVDIIGFGGARMAVYGNRDDVVKSMTELYSKVFKTEYDPNRPVKNKVEQENKVVNSNESICGLVKDLLAEQGKDMNIWFARCVELQCNPEMLKDLKKLKEAIDAIEKLKAPLAQKLAAIADEEMSVGLK